VLPHIIVLTTSKQVQKDLAAQERVVLKPFHIHELLALIQQVIPGSPHAELRNGFLS
jgi:DNA-binding response OmpR family regulator